MNRCTGACCESFVLFARGRYLEIEDLGELPQIDQVDGATIADMVIPLPGPYQEGRAQKYTCRWYDGAARECRIYSIRPRLCQDHGVKVRCAYEGCTLELPPKMVPVWRLTAKRVRVLAGDEQPKPKEQDQHVEEATGGRTPAGTGQAQPEQAGDRQAGDQPDG